MRQLHIGFLLIPLLSIAVLLSNCTPDPDNTPEPEISETYWKSEDPALLGFDLDSLQLAVDRARNSAQFYALLVIRNDKIAAEHYFRGKSSNDLFHLRSITKTFTSALTAIAIDENAIGGLDDKIANYLLAATDGKKVDITVRHLLNMTSGLQWNEDAEVLPLINFQIPNPVQTVLERPVDHTPGSTFNYNSVSPHIVSHIISERTEKDFLDFAKTKLLEPLGIDKFSWEFDPNDEVWGGFGLQLRSRDLARFGKMYLDGGVWEGRQIVANPWVEASKTAQVELNHPSTGYSLQWWTSTGFGGKLFYGQGYGGQALMINPEKNLIIVAFQEHFVPSGQHLSQWRNFADNIYPTIYRAAN